MADIRRREKIAAGKYVPPSPESSEGELVQSTGGETAAPNLYQSTIPSAPRSSGYNTEQPVTGLGQTLPGIALLNPPLRGTQAPPRSSGPSAYNPHDLRIPQIQPGGSYLSAPTPGYQQSSYTTDPAAYASGPSPYEQGATTPYGRGSTNPSGQGATNPFGQGSTNQYAQQTGPYDHPEANPYGPPAALSTYAPPPSSMDAITSSFATTNISAPSTSTGYTTTRYDPARDQVTGGQYPGSGRGHGSYR